MRKRGTTSKGCMGLATAAMLAACIQVPELDDAVSPAARSAPYPQLQPIKPGDIGAATTNEPEEDVQDALNRRIEALQARADRLRGPVVDDAARARLEEGVGQ